MRTLKMITKLEKKGLVQNFVHSFFVETRQGTPDLIPDCLRCVDKKSIT